MQEYLHIIAFYLEKLQNLYFFFFPADFGMAFMIRGNFVAREITLFYPQKFFLELIELEKKKILIACPDNRQAFEKDMSHYLGSRIPTSMTL